MPRFGKGGVNIFSGPFEYSHLIHAIKECRTDEEMLRFFTTYVEWLRKPENQTAWSDKDKRLGPVGIARSNIGWCFGEGMDEARIKQWHRVCGASHPVFGTRTPSPEEAFQMGLEWGKRAKRKEKQRGRADTGEGNSRR